MASLDTHFPVNIAVGSTALILLLKHELLTDQALLSYSKTVKASRKCQLHVGTGLGVYV